MFSSDYVYAYFRAVIKNKAINYNMIPLIRLLKTTPLVKMAHL